MTFMKIIAVVMVAFIAFWAATNKSNENRCPYEGAECPNVQRYLQDYQIQLHMDTVWIWDYDRLVGTFINSDWDSKLDSIIMKDNL